MLETKFPQKEKEKTVLEEIMNKFWNLLFCTDRILTIISYCDFGCDKEKP
jgi:hypothetical protein